ncbi:hypothetical protein QL285_043308 [Trifolium repens]|nr:hypothetical protein QL285_043308 [Trifolium repens]
MLGLLKFYYCNRPQTSSNIDPLICLKKLLKSFSSCFHFFNKSKTQPKFHVLPSPIPPLAGTSPSTTPSNHNALHFLYPHNLRSPFFAIPVAPQICSRSSSPTLFSGLRQVFFRFRTVIQSAHFLTNRGPTSVHHYPGTMGTKRQRPTNKVSTFRAPAPAVNVPAPPPDLVDIVARLDRIEARQQRIEASQQRIEASQERIETAVHQRFDELFRIMDGQIPQPPTQ